MCGYRDEQRQKLSDQTCTALQLANFWQDVRRDLLDRDRIYLPADRMARFGVDEEQIRQGQCSERYRQMLRELVDMTQTLFDAGEPLLPQLDSGVRRQVALFGQGGQAVLSAIRRQNYDTLSRRPVISRWTKIRLMLSALGAGLSRSGTGPGGLA
jgi:phytoene/squalene synthetase